MKFPVSPGAEPRDPALLVIDDEEGNRLWLSRRLAAEGYRVVAAGDGAVGLHHLRTDRFDLVLLDLFMPEMDGLEVLDRIKSDPGTMDTPVMMLTASNTHQSVAHALSLGAVDYVIKPVKLPDLLRRLRARLSQFPAR